MSRKMRWAGNVAHMEERRNSYCVLVKKLEVKRQFGKPRRRWQNNFRMDLKRNRWGKGGLDLSIETSEGLL
jgi:hypothetical protein